MRPTDARPRLTREQIDTTDLNQAEETRLRYAAIVESSHVKHSASRHAHVSINGEVDNINLTVKDSGSGFDPDEAMRGRGLGLTSMNERLKLVGGQLSIHSQVGRGTTIHAVVPLVTQGSDRPRP